MATLIQKHVMFTINMYYKFLVIKHIEDQVLLKGKFWGLLPVEHLHTSTTTSPNHLNYSSFGQRISSCCPISSQNVRAAHLIPPCKESWLYLSSNHDQRWEYRSTGNQKLCLQGSLVMWDWLHGMLMGYHGISAHLTTKGVLWVL